MEEELLREGWALSDKGLEYCKAICANKNPSKKDIITNALHTDIREIGKQRLPADINKQHSSEILGPVVLQILKVKNVSAPNAKEDSSFAPRMLKLTMTDGVVTCSGIEMEMIKAISLSTSPGSKVCLLGNLTVQHGFVLLDSMNIKFLGGEVDHLRTKWEISKNVSKLQRKVLTADGGPPLFVPFEDSDFAKRKPQGPSVTIKHVAANVNQKGKPTHKTEIPSKAFEDKKIWKSESLGGKKGRNPSSAKAGHEGKDKHGSHSQQPRPEANGRQKYEANRLDNMKSFEGGEPSRSASRYGGKKDAESRDDKKIDEKRKERNFGEDKRHYSASSKSFRNVKSAGSEKRKDGDNSGKPRVREDSDLHGHKQQDHFLKDRYEKPNKKSGKYEQPISEKHSLPPRLEKLKQGSEEQEYNKLEYKDVKDFSKKTGESRGGNSRKPAGARNENPVDDAVEKVKDMAIGEIKNEDKYKGIRNSDKRNYTRSSSSKDWSYRKRDYDANHAREDRLRDGKEYNEKRDRFGTEATDRDRRYQDDRPNWKRDGHVDRGRGYGSNRIGKGQERYYNGGERRRSAGQEIDGGKLENGVETEDQGYSNDLDRNQRYYGEMALEVASNKQVGRAPVGAIAKEQMNYSFPSNGNDGTKRIENDTRMMHGREQPDKVKEFMNSVIQNSLQGGEFQLMQQQGSSDLNLPQTRMRQQQPPPQLPPQQQTMVNSSGHVVYDYYPPYPPAMYPGGISQGFPTMPSQDFQPGGYQPQMHQLQPMSQYQGFNVPSTVQDYQFVQAIAPQVNFQNPRMPHTGQQQRLRPRVRHDVFRPKQN